MKLQVTLITMLLPLLGFGQLPEGQIDSLAQATLKAFDVPGMAIGLVENGQVTLAKGYGVRSLNNKLPVTEHTLFGIASNSKAFTCTALAMLVDEGKLSWTDKVKQYIPEFGLIDTYAANNFTILDLVTHRSGLTLGAGDLMFFPEGGNRPISEIIQGLHFLQPQHSFREVFEYNNNLYIVAGEVIRRVSGLTWEAFIKTRIFEPVGMHESFTSYNEVPPHANIIDAHAPVNGKAIAVPHDWSAVANPAGGIMSNLVDMAKWATVVMNNMTLPNGQVLISKPQLQMMWNVHTPLAVSLENPYNTHFSGYGLGWFLSDVSGQFQVAHTGGLIGTVTQFTVWPSKKLAFIVLTNQQQSAAFGTITNTLRDAYLGLGERSWLKKYKERYDNINSQQKATLDSVYALAQQTKIAQDTLRTLLGTYNDPWMGRATIERSGNSVRFYLERSPKMSGTVLPLGGDVYVLKLDRRYYDADAYILPRRGAIDGSILGVDLMPVTNTTDFSFDYKDLQLRKISR